MHALSVLPEIKMENRMTDTRDREPRISDDLLFGAARIAEFLGTSTRVVYHLRYTNRMPIGRLGKNLIASRRELRRALSVVTKGSFEEVS